MFQPSPAALVDATRLVLAEVPDLVRVFRWACARARRQLSRRLWRCTWRPYTAWRMRRSLRKCPAPTAPTQENTKYRLHIVLGGRPCELLKALARTAPGSPGARHRCEGRFRSTSITSNPALPGASEGKEAYRFILHCSRGMGHDGIHSFEDQEACFFGVA